MMEIMWSIFFTLVILFIIFCSVYFSKEEREERENKKTKKMSEQELISYNLKKEKKEEAKRKRKETRQKIYDSISEYSYERRSRKIVKKVMIIGNDSTKSTRSALTRGIVGESLLGPTGAIVGATTAKNKNSTTFLIEYEDGHRESKTVLNGSAEFDELIKYVDM